MKRNYEENKDAFIISEKYNASYSKMHIPG